MKACFLFYLTNSNNCIKIKNMTKEQFIKKAKLVHGNDYDYNFVEYKNNKTKVKIKCNTCKNIFEQRPNNHLNGQNCPFCFGSKKLTTEQFIEKAKQIHGNKYDYSLVDYINSKTKVKIKCNNCGNIFEQIPDVHTNSRHGCTFCSPTSKLNTEQFVEKARIIHGDDYDYSLVEYKNSNTKIKIKCNNCKKIFEQRPYDHLKGCGCFCVYKGEIEIENYLKENNISFEKTKKYSNLKDKSLLSYDFYLPSKNLLIEYNGEQHYKNKFKKTFHEWHRQLHHDWLKRKYAKDNNINLLIIPYWKFGNIKEILDKQS